LRTFAAVVLIIIGALAVSVAVTAHWVETVLLDTDTFVAATEPVLRDPAALDLTSERVSRALIGRLDVRSLAGADVSRDLQPLLETIAQGFEEFVETQVTVAVDSEGFASLTRTRLAVWHLNFASAVTAQEAATTLENTTLRVSLGPYIDLLAEKTDQPLARLAFQNVPDAVRDAEVVVLDVQLFADRLPALRTLHATRPYLPWVAIVALAAGLAVAPRRPLAILGAGVAVVACGALLRVATLSESGRVTARLGNSLGASSAAADRSVHALAGPLLEWSAWVVGAGLVVAVVGVGLLLLQRRRPAQPHLDDKG
jgi:hypothetical protein